MSQLPNFQNDDRDFQLMQSRWAALLNPLLASPFASSGLLKGIVLTTGANTVNHLLGRPLQGWFIVRQRAQASIYDTQDSNPKPGLTLTLVSDANATVDIYVF